MKQNKAAMQKATVAYAGPDQSKFRKESKFKAGEFYVNIVVTGHDTGKDYYVAATEGTELYNLPKGAVIWIDNEKEGEGNQKGMAKCIKIESAAPASTPAPAPTVAPPAQQGKTEADRAKELAGICASTYIFLAEHLEKVQPAPTSEDLRLMTNTILIKL
jgi:hypothetical protein